MKHRGFATRNKSAEDFINEAAATTSADNGESTTGIGALNSPNQDMPYPWENPELSARVQKQYNLRLDEITLEKLRWVGNNVTVSTHQWVVDVLKAAIEEKINALNNS